MGNLIRIGTYNTRIEAEIIKGFLEANGVRASISADNEGGMAPYPFQPSSSGVRLLVSERDVDKARKILDRYTAEMLETKKAKGE